jgi:hypothetical protein
MTLTQLRAYSRFLTNTNSTTFTDADTLVSANVWYDLLAAEIVSSMDDWDIGGEISTTDLVAGQQEYVFPTDIFKIKRIEVSYDGTNWYVAKRFDVSELGIATDTTSILNNFSKSKPFVDVYDNSIFLYPIPDVSVTGGLKIYYEPLVTQLSTGTDEPNMARPFHVGIAMGMAKDYLSKYSGVGSNDTKYMKIENDLAKLRNDMKEYYRSRNQDREYSGFGSGGADYEY